MSEGDRSGIDMDVLDDSVVATEAVVASSNDGGVHGCRPEKINEKRRKTEFILNPILPSTSSPRVLSVKDLPSFSSTGKLCAPLRP